MFHWVNHIIDSTREANGAPSSARIYAGWLLVTVIVAQLLIITTLLWCLLGLDATLPSATPLATLYMGGLKIFMLWSMLFDVATALSLYGINVWKYVAAIRTGSVLPDEIGRAHV